MLAATAALPPAQPVSPRPAQEPNPVVHLIPNLGRDLVRLVHTDTVIWAAVGALASGAAHQYDDNADAWARRPPEPSWTAAGRVGGDGWVQGSLALGTWLAGEAAGHALTAHIGRDLMRAQMLNMVTTRVVKVAVDRDRPDGGTHAMPSGHTSATFATAGVLHRHLGWKVGVPAYAAAGFVGLTRVRDRAHWVSDVTAGAAMGLAAAWTVTRGHQHRSWSVTPTFSAGGAGLLVRW